MMKRIILGGILCICNLLSFGQADSIAIRMQTIRLAAEDSVRLQNAGEIPAFLRNIAYGTYHQLSPVQYLGYKKCLNADVELFSWVIPLKKGQKCYNWIRFREGGCYLLPEGEWLYYDLIGFESKGKPYFVLLGWNKTSKTNRKIVQIARLQKDGYVSLNDALMRRGNSRSATLSFEYALDGSMMLKQDKKGKRIIFDHLAPAEQKYEGYFMFYGPDASYDALVLKGGEWVYTEDVKQ